MKITTYARALGIGAVAGLRSMTAPAATLHAGESPWAGIATLAAGGELVADKLPQTPSRLAPPALAVRLLSGGLCGRAIATRGAASATVGTLVGALGALAGAWFGYKGRTYLTKTRGLPDVPIALAEDGLAIWGARAASAIKR